MRSMLASRILSFLLLLAVWQAGSMSAQTGFLPSPLDVARFIGRETAAGDMVHHIAATLRRVFLAFTGAMLIGSLLGVTLGRVPAANRLLDGWLLLILNTPALVIIVLCYIWLGLTEVAAVLAVTLNKIGNVAVIMREGARTLDAQIEEMRRAFRFDPATWIAHVMIPQLQPYAVASARSGLALVWKIVLVVELLGRPDGVGYAISYYFQLFEIQALIGYSLIFTAVVLAIDFLCLQPLETHARRWRLDHNHA